MKKKKINVPFFIINPKSFLYGESLMELAIYANEMARNNEIDIFFTAPLTELADIVHECPDLIVTAQHVDDINPGDAMGKVLIDSLMHIGVQAVVLNHADQPLAISTLANIIERAKETGIYTIVCTDSIPEAKAVAMLQPDIELAEPTELIGQTHISSHNYVTSTIESIKKVNSNVLVEQGAGIRSEQDVKVLLELGSDGVGVTSGIVKADDPIKMMEKMVHAIATFKEKRG